MSRCTAWAVREVVKMSRKHLKKGDANPPVNQDVVRIYSMQYCPYAQRPRLVLAAKGVQYEVVNCNLVQKPEFLLERNPAGKVPVLEYKGNVIPESLVVCDLLDELFPDKPLTSKDPYQKARDRLVVDKFNQLITAYYKTFRAPEDEELRETFKKLLADFDATVKSQNAPFFGGDKPGMTDLMIWPWLERLPVAGGDKLVADLPNLKAYIDKMTEIPYIKELITPTDEMVNFYKSYKGGTPVYDHE